MKGLILPAVAGICLIASIRPSEPITHLRIVADKQRFSIRPVQLETERAYGLPMGLLDALAHVESSGGKNAIPRHEPKLEKKLRRKGEKGGGGWTVKQLATSYGKYQVLGLNYRAKGYKPADTADEELNEELAAAYLSNCIKRRGSVGRGLLCFNGGNNRDYPKKIARAWIKRQTGLL